MNTTTHRFTVLAATIAATLIAACGKGNDGTADAATTTPAAAAATAAPAATGPRANASVYQYSIMGGEIELKEATYTDGVAYRAGESRVAILAPDRMSACEKLMLVAAASDRPDNLATESRPFLALVRSDEHPKGAGLTLRPYMVETTVPDLTLLAFDDAGLTAKGDFGDAGWGSIDPTKYGREKLPQARLDVQLPYQTIDVAAATAAEASDDAKWLRGLLAPAEGDVGKAVTDALVPLAEGEDDTYERSNWVSTASSWDAAKLHVTAHAQDTGCATLVVRQDDDHSVDYAIVSLVGEPGARRVRTYWEKRTR